MPPEVARGPSLVLRPGTADERVLRLSLGRNVIGRAAECAVPVLDPSVSRQHAALDVSPQGVWLEDLGSRNGVFVGDRSVTRQRLEGGEVIRVGEVEMLYRAAAAAAAAAADAAASMPPRPDMPPPTLVLDVESTTSTSLDKELARRRARKIRPVPAALTPEQRTQERLRLLLEIGKILSGPEPIESLLPKIVDLVFGLFDASRAVILLVEPRSGALEERVTRVADSEKSQPAFSRSIVGRVRDEGVAMLFDDASRDARVFGSSSIASQEIRSVMCVPLKARDRVLGVLYVDNVFKRATYLEEDLELLSAFASQAAIAIDNAELYRRIESEAVVRNNLMRFFPPATVKRIIDSSNAGLEAIETEVTVLFSDITDFTGMSSRMTPTEVVALLNEYFPVMTDIVFALEGTLEKYIGDALLAVWGAPYRQEGDAVRAVRAAVEMQRALAGFNRALEARGSAPLTIHVGLHTGVVAAGNIGSSHYLQYATIGDTTNLASRVCSAAAAGEILISDATLARTGQLPWPTEPLPPVLVKGKREPLSLFRVDWRRGPP